MISAHFARVLYRDLIASGVSEHELLSKTGLDHEQIWHSQKLLPQQFLTFVSNAKALYGGSSLGFMVSGRNRITGLGMMGLAMMSAPTLGAGLQAMASFSGLQAGYIRIVVLAGTLQTRVRIHIDEDVGDCLDIHVESIISIVQEYLVDICGKSDHQLTFNISYDEAARGTDYRKYLHGDVIFGASHNEVLLPSSWLTTLSPFSDTHLWVMARKSLSQQLINSSGQASNPFTMHIRSAFSAQQPPLPDIQAMADSLHVSSRTLNRRLQDEGTTFRQLRLEAIHNWAKRLLLEKVSVEAIALSLGYENPANFRRSFRDYVGCSPTEWLAQS